MMSRHTTTSVWMLLAATLLLRAFVPAGWMPDVGQDGYITAKVCNADYTVRIPLNRKDVPEKQVPHESAPCLFAGFTGAMLPPDDPAKLADRMPPEQIRIAALARLLIERADRITPPGRAPPVTA